MTDPRTRKLESAASASEEAERFFARYRATLVRVSGPGAGSEHTIDRDAVTIGRGEECDIVVEDPSVSRAHAAIERFGEGFRLRDLGSTNGVQVNGSPVQAADLKHGDRLELGAARFQFVLEERESPPRTYVLPEP